MQVFIRLKVGQEEKLSKTLNYTYVPKVSIRVKVLPIPEFIEDPFCSCKAPAKFMLDDMSLICQKCLESVLKSMSTLEKNEDTVVPLTEETLKRIKFEWTPDREGRWYSIRGSGLKPKNVKSFLEIVKKSFLGGQLLVCEAEYDKEKKELMIL